MLKLIYDRKLVRRDHLEIISKSYRHTGDNRTILINRAIKKMYNQMLIDKIQEPQKFGQGNTPLIVAIDKGGSIVLEVPHKKRITHQKSIVKGIPYVSRNLPSNYRHINGVNQCEVDTILFCERTNNSINQWKHEVATEFMHNGEKILFIPDVFLDIEINGKSLPIFIEYDTGSENPRRTTNIPVIYNKILNYRRYKVSKLWEDKYRIFPALLFIVENEERIPYINSKCAENGIEGRGIYYKNFSKVLEHLGNSV